MSSMTNANELSILATKCLSIMMRPEKRLLLRPIEFESSTHSDAPTAHCSAPSQKYVAPASQVRSGLNQPVLGWFRYHNPTLASNEALGETLFFLALQAREIFPHSR